MIRDAGSLRLERSDDFAFDHDLITFRALLRTDSKVLRPQAFARFTGGAVS